MFEYQKVFTTRDDLKNEFGDNALLLYALELRYDIEDIVSVASEALTDGSDDKKCDMIYIDKDNGFSIIAQAYNKKNPGDDHSAPSNKASDLNTAASWIFKSDISDLPDIIKDSVSNLQQLIKDGEINTIHFWYVHNLNESNNTQVKSELAVLQESVHTQANSKYPESNIRIATLEVGNEQIEKWFINASKRIIINDKIEVDYNGNGTEISETDWKAYVTAVKGTWLNKLYSTFSEEELFSGNPRNFLGSGKRKNKINLGIIETINTQPKNFWAYNNGITALVNKYEIKDDKLFINGITIINGAQTTGAIGKIGNISEDFYVPIRFIVCTDNAIIDSIISNNNKQNELLPADFRSNDKHQERLRTEFGKHHDLFYSGGRRDSNPKPRNKISLDPYLIGQTLKAFHGEPVLAYNKRKFIWEDDSTYNSIFTDQLSPEHIIFVYSLIRAIDEYKNFLKKKGEQCTGIEKEQLSYLSKRGSRMLLIFSISTCLESILNKRITDKWKMQFKKNDDFNKLVEVWKLVIKSTLPFYNLLSPAVEKGLKNSDDANTSANSFNSSVTALQSMLYDQLKEFTSIVKIG